MSEGEPVRILPKDLLPPAIKGFRYCPAGKHYTPYLQCPEHNVRTIEVTYYESPV